MRSHKVLFLAITLLSALIVNGQLNIKARVKHVDAASTNATGSILLNITGGTSPYSYNWLQGVNPYNQDRENVAMGAYSIKVKSATNDSVTYTYDLGYKLKWDVLNGTLSRNDSLLLYGTQTGQYRTALSNNILRPQKEGWAEYVIGTMVQPYVIGFAYNSDESTVGSISDIEFAFHLSTGSALYCWSFGYFTFLGYATSGDVLRIERKENTYYLKKNGIVLITKPADTSKSLKIKAQVNGNLLADIGTSFSDSNSPDPLAIDAKIRHMSMDGMLQGNITVNVTGGSSPYIYDWSTESGNSTNEVNFYSPRSTISTISDYDNSAVSHSYNLGYRAEWTDFHTAFYRNDSLLPEPEHNGNSAALSINKLKKDANGWAELVIAPFSSPYIIGFLDSTFISDPNGVSDIDFAFHLTTGNTLYAWSNGRFTYLGNANVGDVIRLARNNSGFYLSKNNIVLHSISSTAKKELRLKALINNGILLNLGCNFTLPLAVDYNKSNLSSSEELNSGSIFLKPKYGRLPYHFLWSTAETGNSLTDIGKGYYSVTITDSLLDTVKLAFLIGDNISLVNLRNMYRQNDNEFVKSDPDKSSSANMSSYIPAGSNSSYDFVLHDVNTSLNFALSPYDTLNGLVSQTPVGVKQSIVSIARSLLPSPGTSEYAKINFADDITTGEFANVIQREFIPPGCDTCGRLLLSGYQLNYGELYCLYNGVTIKKGEPVTNNTALRLDLNNNLLTFLKNESSFSSATLNNNINLIGNFSLNGPRAIISVGNSQGPKPTGVVSAGGSNNNLPPANEGCGVCPNDLTRNYTQTNLFDEQGALVAQNREYSDIMGRVIQTQVKNFSENTILASQVLYDAWGRLIGNTLVAPTNNACFCFKTDFIKNTNNTEYTYNDFDIPNYTANSSVISSGERDNPKALATNIPGTLGWYYSDNNTLEKYTPAAATPYSRIEYSHTDPTSPLRSAKPGYKLNNGSGHETYSFKMNTMGELNHVFGSGNYWRLDQFTDFYYANQCDAQILPCPLMNTAPLSMKSISVDENGVETISFMDITGNVVATCLAGKVNGANVKTQTVSGWLSFTDETQRYIDVHIPEGCENSLSFSSVQSCAVISGLNGGYVTYNILNLKTGRLLLFNGGPDYTGTQPTLPAGYYRIMLKNKPWCINGVSVTQRLNYYNFALYYYDYANRLKAVVSPKGFDNSFTLNANSNYINANKVMKTIGSSLNTPLNFTEGRTWSLSENNFQNEITLNIPQIGPHDAKTMNLNVTFANAFAPSLGEDPQNPSSDERTNNGTTSFGDYTKRTYIIDTTGITSGLDSSFYITKSVYYKVKIALVNPGNQIIENTTQENFLRCDVQQRGEVQKVIWSPLSFNYNYLLSNTSEATTAAEISKLRIISFDLVDLTLGGELSQYESLLTGLKITSGISTLNGGGQPYHTMVERYRYNSCSEIQSKISPDEGETDYVYSKDGKIRYIQNEKQNVSHSNNYFRKFSYVDYDDMNRPYTSGEFTPPSGGVSTQAINTYINKYLYFDNYDEHALYASPSNYISVHDRTEVPFTELSYLHNGPGLAANAADKSYIVYDSYDPQFWTETSLSSNFYMQRHLLNRVSYTYNSNKKTWYSYDEEGRVEWAVQKYLGVNAPGSTADIVKTFQYKYDFLGNITEVIYDSETSTDRLQHYYEYDQDKRLKRVYTSRPVGTNPVTYPKVLQTKYDYYLHGPVKRIELGDKLQGVDYVYTINGWLKSANGPEMTEKWDPGADGYLKNGSLNTTYKDQFGYALEYFLRDYDKAGTYVQSYDDAQNGTPLAPDLFNGTIKGQRWQTNSPTTYLGISYQNQQLMYAYKYDKKYQLLEANFATVSQNGSQNESTANNSSLLGTTLTQDYKVFDLSYDYNGNILSLKRNACTAGTGGLNMDDLTYNYVTCSNRLASVSDAISTNSYNNLGFKPGQTNANYGYFANGELGTDQSNNKLYEYNSTGNLVAIRTPANNLIAEYKYDGSGNRMEKIAYLSGGMKKYTLYIRDISGSIITTFEKTASANTTNFTTPSEWNIYAAGRVGILDNTAGVESYIYELSDHLGNVRTTFKKEAKTTIINNFNSNATTNDDNWFHNNYANVTNAFDLNFNSTATNYFIRTQKPSKPFGAGTKRIPVKNGNSITISWKSLFESGTVPTAGMVAVLTDENGNTLPGSANYQYYGIPGQSAVNTWNTQQVTFNVNANYPNMYLTVYPWNNDASNRVAFFDDISIVFNTGFAYKPELLNMADYYPHGSVIPGMNYNSSYKYKYGYQGQFAEMDDESNENFFELRNYNPLLGRFNNTDPYGQYFSPYMAMGNSHPNMVDPDGGESYDDIHYYSKSDNAIIVETNDYYDRVFYDGEFLGYASQGWGKEFFPDAYLTNYSSNIFIDLNNAIGSAIFGSTDNFNAITSHAGGDNPYMPPNLSAEQYELIVDIETEVVLLALPVGEGISIAAKTFKAYRALRNAKILNSLGAAGKGFSKAGKVFRGGSKAARDGYINSLPKEFRRWFHRVWKEEGAPNASKDAIDEAFEAWESLGRPLAD